MPQDHLIPERNNDPSDEYCEKTDTHCFLADLLEQFQQLKNQFLSLKSNTPQFTPTEELSQLTDKLQHLTMVLQPTPHSSVEPVDKTMQEYVDTLHTTEIIQSHQDLATGYPTFDVQDSSKLEDWLMDIETAADILTESHPCLAEAKSSSLTHMVTHEATQAGKVLG